MAPLAKAGGLADVSAAHSSIDRKGIDIQPVEFMRHMLVKIGAQDFPYSVLTARLPGSSAYFYLVDCPIEIGNQHDFGFTVDGVSHVLSIYGDGNWNADTLTRDIAKIVKTQKEFWGGLPYQRFVFLVHCTPSSGGGTEHINSTIMGTRPYIFKNPDSYKGFLGLVSHEYFHTWNVKQ
ncbi:MAG: aminopeptidase specific for acidic amino acid, partial [Steroidobacteraceae bacterium]|nr:aminopeptidase specific for acidic amino acid [Steroidobacteraceae bacterium]